MNSIKIFLIILLFTITVFSQNVPDTIMDLVNKAQTEHIAIFSEYKFNKLKNFYHFKPETQLSDIKAGVPVKAYYPKYPTLPQNSSLNLEDFKYEWFCPVLEDNKIKLFFVITQKNGVWEIENSGGFTLVAYEWEKIIEAWPYSKNYNPVLIFLGSLTYFHVPEVDDKNITQVQTIKGENNSLLKKADDYKALTYEPTSIKEIRESKGRQ